MWHLTGTLLLWHMEEFVWTNHMQLNRKKTDYSQIIHSNDANLIHLHWIIDIYDIKKFYIAN